jgi:feruloyl esterase
MKFLVLLGLFLRVCRAANLNVTSITCSGLIDVALKYSSIRFSAAITAGSNFTGDSTETTYNTAQTDIPSACRVACEIQTSKNSTARFEVWLPTTAAWNSRFLAVGNGGWAGGINYPDIVTGLKQGKQAAIQNNCKSC